MEALSAILCADWGKESAKRAVYVADVRARAVRRVAPPSGGWSFDRVMSHAQGLTSSGAVIAAFDLPLGVPHSYLEALDTSATTFLGLLQRARLMPRFYDGTTSATDWSLDRPFFSVPAGAGGLGSYIDAANRSGVDLYRRIDKATGAKSTFVKSGIPGSVGSAACALWQELALRLNGDRAFKVWPFEGDLESLIATTSIVVGEIYPRAAYATALLDVPVRDRAALNVAKTDTAVRRDAIAMLRSASWVRWLKVNLENLDWAEANEDDFDACVTAAALLRCVLDGSPMSPTTLHAPSSEGGMLGTGSINLSLRGRDFARPMRTAITATVSTPRRSVPRPSFSLPPLQSLPAGRSYACPIPGCSKVFSGSRGGWDGHVGAVRLHPSWHRDLTDPEVRRLKFRAEFPAFFR